MSEHREILDALLASGVVEHGTASALDAAWQVSREVQRLRAEMALGYGVNYFRLHPEYTGPCPLCQRGYTE